MGHLLINIIWIFSIFSIATGFWLNERAIYSIEHVLHLQVEFPNSAYSQILKNNSESTQSTLSISSLNPINEKQDLDFGSGNITPLDIIDTCPSFQVLYVDSSVAVGGDGSSWSQAFKTLSAAVHVARNCALIDSIVVAQGTYYPTGIQNGSNRDSSFAFQRGGLVVLGGYPSGGGIRDFRNNSTILSGDVGSFNDSSDNSYHIIVISGIGSTADSLIISGFQIENGNADGSNYKLMNGVNISREHGGGIIMTSNTSDKILISDCKIINNRGLKVGGIYNSGTSSILHSLIISGNVSANSGGGIYNFQSSPKILNSLISGNVSNGTGGGIYNNNNAHPLLINMTIVGNSASNGGGIYSTASCNPIIKNSIVYGNSSGIIGGSSALSYNLVQGLTSTVNSNLSGNLNPNFINPFSFAQAPTIAGDYHLQSCSPVINKGNNIAVMGIINSDLDGESRIVDGIVDLGVFEFPEIVVDSIFANLCAGDSITFGNTTFLSSGIFIDTFLSSTQCDSVVTLILTVNPIITDSISASICSGNFHLFGGQQLSVSGVYSDTLQSSTLCDSIVTLTLNVNPIITDSISASICSGNSYLFGGQQLSVSGVYSDTLQSSVSCDSIVTLTLNVNSVITDSISASICSGSSYLFGGQQLSVSGVYSDTLQSSSSCDSIITLTLNVNPIITDSISASICSGDFYLYGGQQLSVAGVYSDTLQSSSNCDSIITLTLNVNSIILDSISVSICSESSYLFGGQQISISGVYSDTLQSSTLCDSIVTLTLNVNSIITDSISANICSGSSYLFGGQQLSVSGVYSDTLQSSSSCDSIITLTLNVNPIITDSISTSICSGSSYLFGGQQLSVAGVYSDTLQSSSSCDSIITLTLNVNSMITDSISASICSGSSYLFGGQQLSVAGVYSDTLQSSSSCDSIITLTLSIHPPATSISIDTGACGNLYFENQNYTNNTSWTDTIYSAFSCDSIYRNVNISIYNAPLISVTIDTIACDILLFNGEEYAESTTIENIYKDIHGCDSLKEVINIVIHYSVRDTIDVLICKGESYEFNGNSYYDSGIYNSVFSQNNGCDSISTLILTVQELPNVQINIEPRKDFYCIGDEIQLIGQGANQYFWTGFEGVDLGTNNYINAILTKRNNRYFVKGIDQWGCENKSNVSIDAAACCAVFVPTAFSPNNDGLNDKFGVQTLGNPQSFSLQIFNRYGEKVFVGFRKDDFWDGKINGKDAAIGTYFYILSGKCADGTLIKQKGDITLVR